jgi:hypothetical protein
MLSGEDRPVAQMNRTRRQPFAAQNANLSNELISPPFLPGHYRNLPPVEQ